MDQHAPEPRRVHVDEFSAWRAAGATGLEPGQSPAAELLAEHHLMTLVHSAMEAEVSSVGRGAELRTDFWRDVVDFIGNFVHVCHRVKEEQQFYPAVQSAGLITGERCLDLENQHVDAKELTLDLCAGVSDGDWERVVRVGAMYVHFMRRHMNSEEAELVQPMYREVPAETGEAITAGFRAIEARVLPSGRQHFVEVARRVCDSTGVTHGL